ncbi:MAG TPA: 3-dehydroquinate synthase [Bacillales bacterium]|nr:3-dehydroquinate synthase [Bacillales bacterium]
MERLTVSIPSKTYPVLIGSGLRHRLSELLAQLPKHFSSLLVITDDDVAGYYLTDVLRALEGYDHVDHYVIHHGERSKSFQTFYDCQTFALEKGFDRKSAILALGGGVVGDVAGFVAATFMRGVGFIQLPTTLLAHDSSVGGKTGINHPLGKNLIGSFYQPDAVIYDTDTLATLPDRELRSGFAEIVKESLIRDAAFYEKLKKTLTTADDLRQFPFETILKQAISVKADIVAEDEKESGVRAHLNFGHTLGHAIEAEWGYGKITHGESVAIGMVFAMKVSEAHFQIKLPIEPFREWLKALGYSTAIPKELSAKALLKQMKRDKKVENEEIRFVAMKEIGQVETVVVDDDLLLWALAD